LAYVETGGSDGLVAQRTLDITNEVIASYKNQAGYDMLGGKRIRFCFSPLSICSCRGYHGKDGENKFKLLFCP
jgi:hypothetical protein